MMKTIEDSTSGIFIKNYEGLPRCLFASLGASARNDREHSTSCDIVRQCQMVKKRDNELKEPFAKFIETEFILMSLRGALVMKQS